MEKDTLEMKNNLLILADDLTGALDSGVQFAKNGLGVEVFSSLEAADSFCEERADAPAVRVINTNSRHLEPEEARAAVRAALRSFTPYSFFYKKTDSCLRGNIGTELEALMETVGVTRLPFIPSYPALGRITRNGYQFLDGKPIHESSMAKDPFNPINESFIPAIIKKHSSLSVTLVPREGTISEQRGPREILVFDGETNEDLSKIAAVLWEKKLLRASAGCAGFAGALMEILPLQKNAKSSLPEHVEKLPLLVVSGSLHSVSINQVKTALKGNAAGFALKPEQLLHPEWLASSGGEVFIANCGEKLREQGIVILGTEASLGGEFAFRESAFSESASSGSASSGDSEMIAGMLGETVRKITEKIGPLHLVIFGGDTLVSIMRNLHYQRLEPLAELRSGIVLVKAFGQGNEGLLVTKSGAFGDEHLISFLKNYFDLLSQKPLQRPQTFGSF